MPKELIVRALAVGAALSGLLAAPAVPAELKVVVYLGFFFVWPHLDGGGAPSREVRAQTVERSE
jgi:hypothetical protein